MGLLRRSARNSCLGIEQDMSEDSTSASEMTRHDRTRDSPIPTGPARGAPRRLVGPVAARLSLRSVVGNSATHKERDFVEFEKPRQSSPRHNFSMGSSDSPRRSIFWMRVCPGSGEVRWFDLIGISSLQAGIGSTQAYCLRRTTSCSALDETTAERREIIASGLLAQTR